MVVVVVVVALPRHSLKVRRAPGTAPRSRKAYLALAAAAAATASGRGAGEGTGVQWGGGGREGRRFPPILYIKTPDRPPQQLLLVMIDFC